MILLLHVKSSRAIAVPFTRSSGCTRRSQDLVVTADGVASPPVKGAGQARLKRRLRARLPGKIARPQTMCRTGPQPAQNPQPLEVSIDHRSRNRRIRSIHNQFMEHTQDPHVFRYGLFVRRLGM